MKMEEHFRETLNRAVANEPPVLDAWDRFEQRAGRGRRIRLFAALAAATALAVASVIVVPKLGSNDAIRVPPLSSPTVDPYEGWQTFTNPDQHYRIRYPAGWTRTMFEGVYEFVPPGLEATDARGAEGSFGVIVNVVSGEAIAPPTAPGQRFGPEDRASIVEETREGSVIVITRRVDWSPSRCMTLATTCSPDESLVLTIRINGENSSAFLGKYRDQGEKIAESVVYVP